MASESDEIGFEASVTPTGIKAKIQSRFLSVVERFFGNKVEKKGLADEGYILIEQAKRRQDIKLIEALGDAAVERVKNDPTLVEQLLESQFPALLRKRDNVAAALEHGAEQLKLLPLPIREDVDDTADAVDEDWLNIWEGHAEKASSDRMRKLWGRIIAGEVRQQGSFSLSTLRVASELDAATAAVFQRKVNARFRNDLFPDDADLDDTIALEGAGLLHGAAGVLSRTFTLKTPGLLKIRLGEWMIVITLKDLASTTLDLPVTPLTKVGRELAAILPSDDKEALTQLGKTVGDEASSATLFLIRDENAVDPGEELKLREI